jgi:ketosteroid isomerase-like protein
MTSSDAPSTQELIEMIRQGAMLGGRTVLDGPADVDEMADLLQESVQPDFVTRMVSESAGSQEFRGIEGFKEALNDWISPYESFRLKIEEAIVSGDKLVFLARQVATTKHDGVEVETQSASVWWAENGQIRQAAFYLDQRAGLEAAGVDPDRPSSYSSASRP